jgi:hypothetical protein
MLSTIVEARRKYGEGVYLTIFPNGLSFPWKRLSLKDYLFYTQETTTSQSPPSVLEDEIFRKCVLDPASIRQLDYMPAGIVSTVVANVIQYSGPIGIDSFNQDLEVARHEILVSKSAVIHDLVSTITLAFPYKPEEVYAMDYETFCLRCVQAEKKLLFSGALKEPVYIKQKEPEKVRNPKGKKTEFDAQEAKRLFDEQHGLAKKRTPTEDTLRIKSKSPKEVPPIKKNLNNLEGTGKWWKKSPILEVASRDREKIDFKTEAKEQHAFGSSSWEKVDQLILQDKMVKDAQKIYKDVLSELAKRKQPPKT